MTSSTTDRIDLLRSMGGGGTLFGEDVRKTLNSEARKLFLVGAVAVTLQLVPIFTTQAFSGKQEGAAASNVVRLGGNIRKNADGKISSILFFEKKVTQRLTDEDIESIDFAAFSELRGVSIIGREISDRSLEQLGRAPELTSVDLVATKITDKGLSPFLCKQTSLFLLRVDGAPITDAVVAEIAKLKDLRTLTLSSVGITDKGAKYLAKLTGLFSLSLAQTEVSDLGLADIAKLEKLMFLDLKGTKVTDAGILQLGSLKNLRSLDVCGTKVTQDGKKALQKLLPNLEINLR